ncbi:MAG: cysteine--tRNA ligase [bacterium]
MPLKIYNTLTKTKQDFTPINPDRVGMYVCGVTVYDLCHVGHARSAIVFDVIYRYLQFKGYNVVFVKNFTDIDDKIINRANKEGVTSDQIAEKYIEEYYKDMSRLGIKTPTHEPRATKHIDGIIAFIKGLIEKGHAYESNGDVYYAVRSFPEYGKLSGKNIEELEAGARVEPGETKLDPLDFALWKKSKPGEPFWESPWGKGRPGWHIECSVMSTYYLGNSFDIHGGGMDLIFPHHENEIAQTEALTNTQFVRYWIHNGFVQLNKEKMSKSLGNFFTIREILERYEPQALRLFILMHHYRSPVDFSDTSLREAEKALYRVYAGLRVLNRLPLPNKPILTSDRVKTFSDKINQYRNDFLSAMDDDFNTAGALSTFFDTIRLINNYLGNFTISPEEAVIDQLKSFIHTVTSILGVFQDDPETFLAERKSKRLLNLGISAEEIEQKISVRNTLRKEKRFKDADLIRAELLKRGISIMDTPSGTIWDIADE